MVGDLVLLFNSKLHLFTGKLISKWTWKLLINEVFPHIEVEHENKEGTNFTVNGYRINIYLWHTESVHKLFEAYHLYEVLLIKGACLVSRD